MSEIGFYSLRTRKLHKKTKKSRLKNFPVGYVGSFYGNLADNINNVLLDFDFFGSIAVDVNTPSEDVPKYILATSDFAKGMQTDSNHYVTRDRINNASFRHKLDPINKNIRRRQNALEVVFEDISTFDAENSTGGFLFCKINTGKKVLPSDLIKNPSGPPEKNFETEKNRSNKLRGKDEPIDNNNFSPPPLPFICTSTWLSFQPALSVFGSFSRPPPQEDLTITLVTFISQHYFHLKILPTRDCQATYLVCKQQPLPKKRKKLFRTVLKKNRTIQ